MSHFVSRFTVCPRKDHIDRALRIFRYIKNYNNRVIVIDSRDPIHVGGNDALNIDYTKMFEGAYPYATENINTKISPPRMDELEITALLILIIYMIV